MTLELIQAIFEMNTKRWYLTLQCNNEEESFVFNITFWSYPEFQRISPEDFMELNDEDMKMNLLNLYARVEHKFIDYRCFHYLGYRDPCTLVNFIDSHRAQIINLSLGMLHRSTDPAQHPHFMSVDIYLLEREIDFLSYNRQGQSITTPACSLPRL